MKVSTKFIINNFHTLSIDEQKEIQDYIAGITSNFIIQENNELEEKEKKS